MWQPETLPVAYTSAVMMKPNAKEMPSRSASVTAGVALPASVRVATTEPGPTRTSTAVPNASASPRCVNEYIVPDPPFDPDSTMSNTFQGTVHPGPLLVKQLA